MGEPDSDDTGGSAEADEDVCLPDVSGECDSAGMLAAYGSTPVSSIAPKSSLPKKLDNTGSKAADRLGGKATRLAKDTGRGTVEESSSRQAEHLLSKESAAQQLQPFGNGVHASFRKVDHSTQVNNPAGSRLYLLVCLAVHFQGSALC